MDVKDDDGTQTLVSSALVDDVPRGSAGGCGRLSDAPGRHRDTVTLGLGGVTLHLQLERSGVP